MPKIVDRNEMQNALLRAAGAVLRRAGITSLTIDAIAAEAGVSKGGILHYFKTKQEVLIGLVSASMEAFETAVERRAARDPDAKGSWTRAYLAVSARPGEEGPHMGYAVAWANDPTLLRLVQERYARWRKRLDADGIDPVAASIVRMAADGLWQADGLGLAPLKGEARAAFLKRLDLLTHG